MRNMSRVGYLESRLDSTVKDFKEAVSDLKEAIKDNREDLKEAIKDNKEDLKEAIKDNKEAMRQMEARHQANFAELKNSLEKVVDKAESSRRWAVGTVITITVAVISFLLAVIGFLFTNGFQAPT